MPNQILNLINNDAEATLHNDILVAKRDFLLILLTLKYLEDDELNMWNYYHDHLMPQLPEQERIKGIEDLKKHLAENLHVLAQGLRRIDAAENRARQLARVVETKAYKGGKYVKPTIH